MFLFTLIVLRFLLACTIACFLVCALSTSLIRISSNIDNLLFVLCLMVRLRTLQIVTFLLNDNLVKLVSIVLAEDLSHL